MIFHTEHKKYGYTVQAQNTASEHMYFQNQQREYRCSEAASYKFLNLNTEWL